MLNDPLLKFVKSDYDKQKHDIDGVVCFDNIKKSVILKEQEFGPYSAFNASKQTPDCETQQEIINAKNAYDLIISMITPINDENSYSTLPKPKVVFLNKSKSLIQNLEQNTIYVCKKPMNQICIKNSDDILNETIIYFSVCDDFFLILPNNMHTNSDLIFKKGYLYSLSFKDNIITKNEYTIQKQTVDDIYHSSTIKNGFMNVYGFFEFNEKNVIIDDVKPNFVYYVNNCKSLRLDNIKSSSLETIIYISTKHRTTITYRSDIDLYSNDQVRNFMRGNYVMTIKNAMININKIK